MSEVIQDLYPAYEANTSKYQDYAGFTFNNIHSSDLGIVRTSDGSRFNENLLPTFQDKTVQVPGGDGTYFFGSYFTQKQLTIPFAFDALTEEKFMKLKKLLGDKKIHDLIFDEAPYKIYRAKVTGSATIKHIPFSEGETNRLYKGEGSIQFTCYQPYALVRFKTREEYENEGYNNIDEWIGASGILTQTERTSKVLDEYGAGTIKLYNPGHIDSHFQLRIDFVDNKILSGKMYLDDLSGQMTWKDITAKSGDTYVVFNSKLNLIEGYGADSKKTGNIYNEYITSGAFFKIPMGESELTVIDTSSENTESSYDSVSIDYSYYYL